MLSVLLRKKRDKETLVSAGYVYYLDYVNDTTSVCICSNSSNCSHEICSILCISVISQ